MITNPHAALFVVEKPSELSSAQERNWPSLLAELQTLAKRALLDISDNKKIRQDLATMIHFLRQLGRVKGRTMTACDIYDIPRGVTKAPLRTGVATPNETKEAKQVYKSLLQPKTIQQGGHEYFSVVTKIEKKE